MVTNQKNKFQHRLFNNAFVKHSIKFVSTGVLNMFLNTQHRYSLVYKN
jgi:hypothetical protein